MNDWSQDCFSNGFCSAQSVAVLAEHHTSENKTHTRSSSLTVGLFFKRAAKAAIEYFRAIILETKDTWTRLDSCQTLLYACRMRLSDSAYA